MPLRLVLHPLLRLATLFVGYFLPALNCIKSILHKDEALTRASILHFVVLYFVHGLILPPLFRCGALNPLLEFPIVFWLAGPTRGSMVIYECVVMPLLARFEGQVDEEIERRRREVRDRTVRFMLNGGAALVAQLWDVISNAVTMNETDENGDLINGGEDDAPKNGLDPQHSVRASLHSIQSSFSQDSIDANEGGSDMDGDGENDQETYIRDFLAMLERGLYVFAHIASACDDDNAMMDTDDNDDATNKTFRLRIFSYSDDSNSFQLSMVDHHQNDPTASTTLPVLEIGKVEASGCQAITISLSDGSASEVEIVLSDEDDRNILLGGLEACIDHFVGVDASNED
eukprot:CAMPEP_0181021166 /NCGR_PEP_ID=MMETSP1070-20121207/838_1 /TAXON_ID=265543 /ORGANISM="Minutocellus polymorphus, Strain NH13" /LENGTH=343 /DNA_ID=CAMNT_0023098027 /DNA_START=135 /DNA_END=1166 /DNA_ORIENTATION=+